MASKYHKKIRQVVDEANLSPALSKDLEKELESYFYEKEKDLAFKGLKPTEINTRIENEFGEESTIAAFFKWVYHPNFIQLLTHFLMKFRLRHLGYTIIAVTLFLNLWFYQANLHEMIFGTYGCHFDNPCLPWDVSEDWENWEELRENQGIDAKENIDAATFYILYGYFSHVQIQITWIEFFLTAMFDTLLLSLAFGMILYPEPKKN